MNHEDEKKVIERAQEKREQGVGAVTTVLILLTAGATLMGHRAHTEEVRVQNLVVDDWSFYQAKHIRAHMYGIEAEKALADHKDELALRYLNKAIYEQCGSPRDPSCHYARCGGQHKSAVEKENCQVPVLKDSPELQRIFTSNGLGTSNNGETGNTGHLSATEAGSSPAAACEGAEEGPDEAGHELNGAIPIFNRAKKRECRVRVIVHRAKCFDVAEILLEGSIMLCGMALLVGTESHRKYSFLFTGIGVVVAVIGIGFALFAWPWF